MMNEKEVKKRNTKKQIRKQANQMVQRVEWTLEKLQRYQNTMDNVTDEYAFEKAADMLSEEIRSLENINFEKEKLISNVSRLKTINELEREEGNE